MTFTEAPSKSSGSVVGSPRPAASWTIQVPEHSFRTVGHPDTREKLALVEAKLKSKFGAEFDVVCVKADLLRMTASGGRKAVAHLRIAFRRTKII
ncbi:hypothetical protein [Bradyrhizobium sp. LA7.1]|uniref:hypothetical protein n=1 Tax=Bradyrhizobium sp. LA7.1 TaxID=3156324 RepID=UPI0033938715